MSINNSYRLKDIAALCEGEFTAGGPDIPIGQVCIDTRQLTSLDTALFIAIKTQNRDGHQYISEALRKGVTQFIVSNRSGLPAGVNVLCVEDTVAALQQWAAHHRAQFSYPVIGITGSNGKTIVKEWLASLLEAKFRVVKSPMSYNSQIGVPLSLLKMESDHDIAIIEAGISEIGEMAKLERLICPDIGILTHFGDAHAEGFSSPAEKLTEKLALFSRCKTLLHTADDAWVMNKTSDLKVERLVTGENEASALKLIKTVPGSTLELEWEGTKFTLEFHQPGQADVENVLLAVLAALKLGVSISSLSKVIPHLEAVSMRMELISDNPEITLINDAYNADSASIQNAFSQLEQQNSRPEKYLILTDLEHQGATSESIHLAILQDAIARFGAENIFLIGPIFTEISKELPKIRSFPTTQALIDALTYDQFRNRTVLLKGARKFGLERLIPYLSRRVNATWFKVNLNRLVQNYRYFRQKLAPSVKIMSMVKAFSYGSGTWEIARELEQEGVDYFAVAYLSEGIQLRSKGIRTPIMVMNPDPEGIDQLLHFDLEPEVYSLKFLSQFYRVGRLSGKKRIKIHLKLDTGMHRLGFSEAELPEVQKRLAAMPQLEVRSALSHLAAADDPTADDFTKGQIAQFQRMYDVLFAAKTEKPLRHILNSSGILRFPAEAMEMARLGIGMYGVSPLSTPVPELQEIGSLHTVISQVRTLAAGTPVGYGRSQTTTRDSKIATIPIGYADGIPRLLSNGKISFLVRGKPAPTFGKVCMDMIMLDVTDISEVSAGDEVVLFGEQDSAFQSVNALAEASGTISYEILAGISQRVRRVFVKE